MTSGTSAQLVVDTAGFVAFGTQHVEAAYFGNSGAESDIGTTTCHVGGDGHLTLVAGELDDFCFAAVVLGVQNFVGDALFFQRCLNTVKEP